MITRINLAVAKELKTTSQDLTANLNNFLCFQPKMWNCYLGTWCNMQMYRIFNHALSLSMRYCIILCFPSGIISFKSSFKIVFLFLTYIFNSDYFRTNWNGMRSTMKKLFVGALLLLYISFYVFYMWFLLARSDEMISDNHARS